MFSGASETLVIPYTAEDDDEPDFHGKDGFNDVDFGPKPDVGRIKSEGAVDAIRRIINENPSKLYSCLICKTSLARALSDEITLVTMGPLTNVALAFKLDPGVPSLLKDLYIMGGNVEAMGNSSIASEFNFDADPEAAYIVLNKTACPTYLAPYELCVKYSLIPFVSDRITKSRLDA